MRAADGDSDYDHEWECDQTGKAAPLSFTIAAWEDDGELPFTGFCGDNLQTIDERGPDILRTTASFCVEDRGELIGKQKIEFSLDELNAMSELQTPGGHANKQIDLVSGCDATEGFCDKDGAPHYRLRYSVRRVPDATGGLPVDPNP
jgi:hypothetical protein